MKVSVVCLSVVLFLTVGCANQQPPCEDVVVAKEQLQQCQQLQKQINAAKDKPIIRTELERRYQQECVEIRYYREQHQSAVCGNKEKIKALTKEAIKEQKQ